MSSTCKVTKIWGLILQLLGKVAVWYFGYISYLYTTNALQFLGSPSPAFTVIVLSWAENELNTVKKEFKENEVKEEFKEGKVKEEFKESESYWDSHSWKKQLGTEFFQI